MRNRSFVVFCCLAALVFASQSCTDDTVKETVPSGTGGAAGVGGAGGLAGLGGSGGFAGIDAGTQPDAPVAPPADGGADADSAAPSDCFLNPKTHEEIINACTNAVRIDKRPVLPLLGADGGLPPLP
jgi:hypothetical protein